MRRSRPRVLTLVIAAIALAPQDLSVAVVQPPEMADSLSSLVEAKKLTASDSADYDKFGHTVAVSGDTVAVGAWENDDAGGSSGSAYVFERNQGGAGNWGQVKKLVASDAAQGDSFGYSVGISGDVVVVGAFGDDDAGSGSGSAYVFERNQGGAGNWGQVKKLTASDAAGHDNFGWSVAISADTIVVGGREYYSGPGLAYVFERNQGGANNWGQVKKLTSSDGADGDRFGYSVAISADTVVSGAYHDDDAGNDSGSAYVFERNQGGAGNWGEVKKLTASDAAADDSFGDSVGVSGDTVAVGAYGDDDAGGGSGSAYVFGRNQGGVSNWGEVKKLTASDAAGGDEFGYAVAVYGDTMAIGAWKDDDAGSSSGSTYVFLRNEGGASNWGEGQKLIASDAGYSEGFGGAVGISADTVLIGAPFDDAGNAAGSAYVFELGIGCYILDGFGGVHPAGAASAIVNPAPPYFGFDIARDLELSGNGAYVLDGWGGVHPAGGEPTLTPGPPYFGFDIAQDIELEAGGGGYVLDGFGGIHAIGGAPALSPATPYFGFDAARDLELGGGGCYVLDGWGGLHAGAGATPITPGPPYFGFDISQDVELASGGGAYALDGHGGVYALGGAPVLTPPTPYFGFDIARDLELAYGGGHYVLDGYGGLHAGGGAAVISPAPPYFGFDAARDLEIR